MGRFWRHDRRGMDSRRSPLRRTNTSVVHSACRSSPCQAAPVKEAGFLPSPGACGEGSRRYPPFFASLERPRQFVAGQQMVSAKPSPVLPANAFSKKVARHPFLHGCRGNTGRRFFGVAQALVAVLPAGVLGFGFGKSPSRCARFRAAFRSRRIASDFSRTRFSEGFS